MKNLGKEPETLARWGESWQDMEAPPQGVPEDIADLLGVEAENPDTVLDAPREGQDFASFLDDLSVEESGSSGEAETPSDGFELPDAFRESAPEPVEDDYSVPESLLEGFDALTEPDADAPDEPEAFDIPEELETIEEAPETLEAPEATETPEIDSFSVPDSLLEDSFGLDDLESLAERPADESGSEPDEFAMPDFGDETATVPEEAPPEEPAPEEAGPLEEPAAIPEAPTPDSSFDLGSESMEGDSFDQFDLGGSSQETAVPDLGAADFDAQFGAIDGGSPTADNFSLDADWGGDFTIPGFEMGGEAKPAPGAKPAKPSAGAALSGAFGSGAKAQAEAKARPVELTDAQADALQDTLLSYPLNLRLAIEDIVANGKGTEAQQSELIWLLVERATAKDAAKQAGRVLKRYIEVPASFSKRTGAAFEAEKGSFRYIFVHSILPVLQVLVLVAAAAGAVFYLGYTFAYRPLKANALYADGYRQIGLSKYGESLEFFDRADKQWTMRGWHYRYAEAYAGSGQYPRAEAMYDRLLQRWPKETEAALDYATMETGLMAYAKAESVLQQYILGRDYFNKRALALSARNFLDWADFEEQRYAGPDAEQVSGLYEKARLQLATLMERHGRSDAYMELMLVYLVRTERSAGDDKLKEILPLASYFVENKKSAWSAPTLAELADYLLDRNETQHVNALLLAAVDRDGTVPEAHAAMARWNRRSGFPDDELKALEYAARFYAEADAESGLAPKRVKRYVESMMRLGELRRADGRSLDAEDAFNVAIDRYERALAARQFKAEARFGRAYSLLADVYYAERMDFAGALALYSQAEDNGYTSPDTDYRRGYIHYMAPADDGSAALKYFYRAGLDLRGSPYLQWATANALYARDDFFAAQGYYAMLANRLQFELETLALPSPQTKPSHEEIVQLLMMTRNNLGAALYRVAERMGDAGRRADAMAEFTESARLFDSLARDQRTMVRPDSKNLGFLNLDFVLHPLRGIDLGIYKTIPAEMGYPRK